MIKSMTGFASLTREEDFATIGLTIRTVNHRYVDLQLRLPQSLADQEPRLRAIVQRCVGRGRVEVAVALQLRRTPATEIQLNEQFLAALVPTLDRARELGLVAGPLTAGDLVRFPQALTIRERSDELSPGDLASLQASLADTLEDALAELDAMRLQEGTYLRRDLDARWATVSDLIGRLADAASDGSNNLEARLASRLSELSSELKPDPSIVAQEIVRFVARSDIAEEVARLRGHLQHWTALADSEEPCGRKLDFLLQEMNREINTIAAKAEGLRVSELIVATKAELEKMREQVQNVE